MKKNNNFVQKLVSLLALCILFIGSTSALAIVDLVVETGDSVTGTAESLTGINNLVSINDRGEVAFVGFIDKGSSVFATSAEAGFRRLSFDPPSIGRVFGRAAAINNNQHVAARDRVTGSTTKFLARRWVADDDPAASFIDVANTLSGLLGDPEDYEALGSFMDINDSGDVVFFGIDTDFTTLHRLHVRSSAADGRSLRPTSTVNDRTIEIGDFPSSTGLRPQISNRVEGEVANGVEVVFRSPSGSSILKTEPGKPDFFRIAGGGEGFSEVGRSPGITDDGTAVAFYGVDANGPGIWLSVVKGRQVIVPEIISTRDRASRVGRQLFKIAGMEDLAVVGPLEPRHFFVNFGVDSRIGVAGRQRLSETCGDDSLGAHTAFYYVTFIAQNPDTGADGVWRSTISLKLNEETIDDPNDYIVSSISQPEKVVELGDLTTLFKNGSEVNRIITNIELYDPISNNGSIGFWAEFDSGNHGILRFHPDPSVVNVVTHGFNPTPPLFSIPTPLYPIDVGEPWSEFRDAWYSLAKTLNEIPSDCSPLKGKVRTYVSEWESSEGFLPAFMSLIVAKFAHAAAIADPEPVTSTVFDGYYELFKLFSEFPNEMSSRHANIAALKIVADLEQRKWLKNPEDRIKIHLIGHSRGGAVSARVSKWLVEDGFNVNQVSVLDGFSTDWPDDASRIADISIVDETTVFDEDDIGSRKVNYMVKNSLNNWLAGLIDEGVSKINEPLIYYIAENLRLPVEVVRTAYEILLANEPVRREFLNFDIRAPIRPGFDNVFVDVAPVGADENCSGLTNHLNITRCYTISKEFMLGDTPYILDNYVGKNR